MSAAADMSVCEAGESPQQHELTPPQYVFARNKNVSTEDLLSLKEEIKTMIQSLWAEQQKEFKNFTSTILLEIKETNTNIENSIASLSAQNLELANKITHLENKCKEDKEYIAILEEKVENLQMGQRKSNLEIKNVPKKNGESKEDLIEMVLRLSSTIGGTLRREDITDIYRVRGKKELQNPPIVIETSSTLIKTDILKLCKAFNVKTKSKLCAKHLGFRTSEDTPVFISEHLTPRGSRLHFLARDLSKSKQYKYCWTAYGKVYVRKTDNSPIITIKSEAQVHQLKSA